MKKILISLLSIIILNSQAQATLGYSSYFPSMFTAFYEIVSQKSNTDSAWVTEQTTLAGGSNVTINVGNKTTVTGAVINSESNNLTLTTKALEHNDIEDRNITESKGFGLSTSIGTSQSDKGKTNVAPNGSTTLTLKNTGEEKEQKTKATIGNGTIIIGGVEQTENDLQGLNRNVTNTQEITRAQTTNALNAEFNVDVRFVVSGIEALYTGDIGKWSVVEDAIKLGKGLDYLKDELIKGLSILTPSQREEIVKKIEYKRNLKFVKELQESATKKTNEEIREQLEKQGIDPDDKQAVSVYFATKIEELTDLKNKIEKLEEQKTSAKTQKDKDKIIQEITNAKLVAADIYAQLPLHPNYIDYKKNLDNKLVEELAKNSEIVSLMKDPAIWNEIDRKQYDSVDEYDKALQSQDKMKERIIKTIIELQSEVYNSQDSLQGGAIVGYDRNKDLQGSYNSISKTLTINYNTLDYSNKFNGIFDTIIHEGEHANQNSLINKLNKYEVLDTYFNPIFDGIVNKPLNNSIKQLYSFEYNAFSGIRQQVEIFRLNDDILYLPYDFNIGDSEARFNRYESNPQEVAAREAGTSVLQKYLEQINKQGIKMGGK
ncbi:hypothetical protein [Endomicrobium proavitum]|uniref:Uncharacterized protein n=1 Tax=Endomicrobium proavitum TaxID=1408281 RepID=A0A0G3WK08_9BACT|nr:hypothetical protein [Endomicrobium proavitum]AKL98230.1 exported protein of unknown function [Endomicrobium proavitum]